MAQEPEAPDGRGALRQPRRCERHHLPSGLLLRAPAGDGSANSIEEGIEVLRRYKKALGAASLRRLHVHLSGIEYTAKGERKHLPIAESDFNLDGLFAALAELRCKGRILCERPVMGKEALVFQAAWDRIAGGGGGGA